MRYIKHFFIKRFFLRFPFVSTLVPRLFFDNLPIVHDLVRSMNILARESVQRMRREELSNFQLGRLESIIRHAVTHIPYWRDYWQAAGKLMTSMSGNDLKELPILRKEQINEQFNCFVDPGSLQEYYEMNTSGSSGMPFTFRVDKSLFNVRAFALHFILKMLGCHMDVSILRLSYQDFPWANYQGIYFDPLSLDWLNKNSLMVFLERHKPRVLYGTVSHILLFAEFFNKNNILWKFDLIITRSEQLTRDTRTYFREIFNAEVYNIYASREFGPIGYECSFQEGFHINEDLLFVEVVDEKGDSIKIGETGNILVTSFYNKSMPFIRYQLGDRGHFIKYPCNCGLETRRIIFEGRSSDFIYLPDGRMIPILDLLRHLGSNRFIRKFQFIQPSIKELKVRVVFNNELRGSTISTALIKKMEAVLKCSANFHVTVEAVKNIPLLENGKQKILLSNATPFLRQERRFNKKASWQNTKL